MHVLGARLAASVALALVGSLLGAWPAAADEPGETDVGYVLVQQALAHLAHDSSAEGIDAAMEKVADAKKTDNNNGVDLPTLDRAEAALEAGQVNAARRLLQRSIRAALHNRPPATGVESGTTVVRPALPGRSGLAGQDWGFLAVSVLALLLGLWLAVRFRPHDSVRSLRAQLAADGTDPGTLVSKGGES